MAGLSQRLGITRYEADEHYKQALKEFEKDNLAEAIDHVELAIRLLPTNPEYHAAIGLFHLKDGVDEKAKAAFEEALKIHPTEALANYGMGMLAFQEKAWDEAIAWFKKAAIILPERVEIPYYMALAYHRQRQNLAALPFMQRAHELMEAQNDKRKGDAKKWVKAIEKLIQEETNAEKPVQTRMDIRVSGPELPGPKRPQLETSTSSGNGENPDEEG